VKRAAASAVVGALIAVLILWSHSKGNINRTAYGDGLIYRYVASHLNEPRATVDPVVSSRGSSLRYGRIGLPGAIWLLSAGRSEAMPWAQAALMVFSAAAASAAMALLVRPAGPLGALLPFLAPGFPEALSGGFADAFAVALCLWAVVLAVRDRWGAASIVLAIAILTRENAGVVLLGLAAWGVLKRSPRVVLLGLSVIPTIVWYLIIAGRYGHIPLFDPYLRVTTQTIGPPVVALYRSIVHPASTAAEFVLLAHLLAAAVGIIAGRRTIFGVLVAAASLQLLVSGPFAWQLIGEATRTAVILQTFFVAAITSRIYEHHLDPEVFLPAVRRSMAEASSVGSAAG
jgi:hypothetical protein